MTVQKKERRKKLSYSVHAKTDDKDDGDNKDYKDTGKDDKSDSHGDIDDNKDPKKVGGQTRPLLDIQDRDDIHLEHDAYTFC